MTYGKAGLRGARHSGYNCTIRHPNLYVKNAIMFGASIVSSSGKAIACLVFFDQRFRPRERATSL